MSSQIAIRIPDTQLSQLDEAVRRGEFESRAEAVRRALANLLSELRERRIAREYMEAYGQRPDDRVAGEAGAALLADAVRREELERH